MQHFAAYNTLLLRRIVLYTPAPSQCAADLIDERSQASEIVRAQPRSTGGGTAERVRLVNVGPRRQQRAKMPVIIEERHAVLTPVLLARRQHEALAPPWMECVRDLELNGRTIAHTACSS